LKQVRKIRILLPFLFGILFISCSESEIEIDTLAKIYVDLAVVEDYYNNTDSVKIKTEEIFFKYKIDENKYKDSFVKFGSDKEKWDEFYNLANTYLDTLKSNLKKSSQKTE